MKEVQITMKKIILTKGLPASGKTTWAKKTQEQNPHQYKRINKDDLRAMFDNGKWSRNNEKFILNIQEKLVIEALRDGKHVIIDDTNLHPKHEERMKRIAKKYITGVQVKIKDFTDVTPEVCIERDLKRANSVGQEVIMKMYKQFLKEEKEVSEKIEYDNALGDCYIVDIDGTLAVKSDRSPYDWHRVDEDAVNEDVLRVVQGLQNTKKSYFGSTVKFIIFTGRDAEAGSKTLDWLKKNKIKYDEIHFRNHKDMRKDSIVKKEMYEKFIKGKYNVLGIFDDRKQVVEMWRDLGLTVFQVDEGDF